MGSIEIGKSIGDTGSIGSSKCMELIECAGVIWSLAFMAVGPIAKGSPKPTAAIRITEALNGCAKEDRPPFSII